MTTGTEHLRYNTARNARRLTIQPSSGQGKHSSKRSRQDATQDDFELLPEQPYHAPQPPVQPSPDHRRLFFGSTGGNQLVFCDLFLPVVFKHRGVNRELNHAGIDRRTETIIAHQFDRFFWAERLRCVIFRQ